MSVREVRAGAGIASPSRHRKQDLAASRRHRSAVATVHPARGRVDDYTGVLWSVTVAHDIVAVIAEDAATGLLLPAEAMDLIDRVRARAARPPA